MKYIKDMEIVNFQSHRNTKISFENGLNVICGPSDNGKSAIIRALKWVLYNEPKGTDFITQGEKNCRVSITLSDGTVVTRERSGGKNIYRLSDDSGKETTFEGFGGDIPPEILSAHGIIKLHIDSSSSQCINIADQLEAPFLISQPGSVKAKAIGKLVGVNIIDEAVKELGKELSSLQSKEKSTQEELEGVKDKLKAYENLPRMKNYIDLKERRIDQIKSMSTKCENLLKLNERLKGIESEMAKNSKLIKELSNVDEAFNLLDTINRDNIRAVKIEKAAESYRSIEEDIARQKDLLQRTKDIDSCMFKITDAYKSCVQFDQLSQRSSRLKVINSEIAMLKESLEKMKNIEGAYNVSIRLSNDIRRLEKLDQVKKSYDSVGASIRKGQEYIKMFKSIDRAAEENDKLMKLMEKLSALARISNIYKEQDREIAAHRKDIYDCEASMNTSLDEYKKLLKAIGRCPVCFSPIDEHTMEDIVREFEGGNYNG